MAMDVLKQRLQTLFVDPRHAQSENMCHVAKVCYREHRVQEFSLSPVLATVDGKQSRTKKERKTATRGPQFESVRNP